MWEFMFGAAIGVIGTMGLKKFRGAKVDSSIQTNLEQPIWFREPEPILIPKKRTVFVPGELRNFWGSDS